MIGTTYLSEKQTYKRQQMSIKYSLVIQVDSALNQIPDQLSDKLKAMIKVNKEKRFYQEAMLIAVNCLFGRSSSISFMKWSHFSSKC